LIKSGGTVGESGGSLYVAPLCQVGGTVRDAGKGTLSHGENLAPVLLAFLLPSLSGYG
jgi:hypothetical protein